MQTGLDHLTTGSLLQGTVSLWEKIVTSGKARRKSPHFDEGIWELSWDHYFGMERREANSRLHLQIHCSRSFEYNCKIRVVPISHSLLLPPRAYLLLGVIFLFALFRACIAQVGARCHRTLVNDRTFCALTDGSCLRSFGWIKACYRTWILCLSEG